MAHVVLIRPPIYFRLSSYSVVLSMPIAVAYLAANLRRFGHTVNIIDGIGEAIDQVGQTEIPKVFFRGLSHQQILERIGDNPDVIGISAMFTADWPQLIRLVWQIRQKYPAVPVLIGGEHATATADKIVSQLPKNTFIALGEGEQTIVDFTKAVELNGSLSTVPGLVFFQDGEVRYSPQPQSAKIRELPWPAWDLVDLEPYMGDMDGYGVARGRSIAILASRGCSKKCRFCSSARFWKYHQEFRDPDDVVVEIIHYVQAYQIVDFHFIDLNLVVRPKWVKDFCNLLIDRNVNVTWQLPTGVRTEVLSKELLELMHAAGCRNLTLSPESGSWRTLLSIKKPLDIEKFLDIVRNATQVGIHVKCNIIIGFPDENWADILQTIKFTMRLALAGADDVGIFVYAPLPGSDIYKELEKMGMVLSEWDDSDNILAYMDVTSLASASMNVNAKYLRLAQVGTMAAFYQLGFATHPWRMARFVKNAILKRSDTVFEQRVLGWLRRVWLASSRLLLLRH